MKKNLYQELVERKNKGEKLEWNDITKGELEELFEKNTDNMIADLYNVSKSQVKNKREKWDIKQINYIWKRFLDEEVNKKIFEDLNQSSKERLLKKDNIETISIALTHYLFRNGPVEDMHRKGNLSQEDMKTLNKFMANRIAGLLQIINKEEWLKIELLLDYYNRYFR
ncbi:MAG: hypothetical protein HFJ52_02910 [Clostridia bacterium]|nr:hypothetical protein [Clostridia bacterium]